MPTSDDEIAFLPAHRLSALIKERKLTSERADRDLSRAHQATRSDAALRGHDHGRPGARRGAARDAEIAAGKYRGPLHGIPYGVKDLFSTKGVRTTWGSRDFENRDHRRGRRDRGAAARCGRGADGEAGDGPVRATTTGGIAGARTIPWDIRARIERIVGRSVIGDRGRMRRVRDRNGDERIDRVAGARVRLERAASDVRAREPLRRNGARRGRGTASVRSAGRSRTARWCSTRFTAWMRRIRQQ